MRTFDFLYDDASDLWTIIYKDQDTSYWVVYLREITNGTVALEIVGAMNAKQKERA